MSELVATSVVFAGLQASRKTSILAMDLVKWLQT